MTDAPNIRGDAPAACAVNCFPDRPGAAAPRKAEPVVRSPRDVVALKTDVLPHTRDVGDGDPVADPSPIHQLRITRPDFAVVRAHEDVRDPRAERSIDPFAKVLRRPTGLGRGHRRLVEAAKTGGPLRLGQTVKIELERVRHETAGNPHPRLAIVIEPSIGPQQVVHQLVEHLVVAELHVAAEIPRETVVVDNRLRQAARHAPAFKQRPVADATLLKAPRGTETGWPRADDQMLNLHVRVDVSVDEG